MTRFIPLCCLLLSLVACGQNYAGTYKGTESFTQDGTSGTATLTVVVTESDGTVSGSWSSSSGSKGVITGTLKDGAVDPFTLEETSGSCAGAYVGYAKLDSTGNTLTGYANGTAKTCGEIKAGFTLIRQ